MKLFILTEKKHNPTYLLHQTDCLLPDGRRLAIEVLRQEVSDEVQFLPGQSLCSAETLAEEAQCVHPHLHKGRGETLGATTIQQHCCSCYCYCCCYPPGGVCAAGPVAAAAAAPDLPAEPGQSQAEPLAPGLPAGTSSEHPVHPCCQSDLRRHTTHSRLKLVH